MLIKGVIEGMIGSNCYIIGGNKEAAIIDAGSDPKEVCSILDDSKLTPKYIILTHGHIDHILKINELYLDTGAEVAIYEQEQQLLTDPEQNFSQTFGEDFIFDKPVKLLKDGDRLVIDDIELEIIHTPGHSEGSICIKVGDSIFTGDTLFSGSIGRTDLRNGNFDKIKQSIERLMKLEPETKVYPGHGESTTIGQEKMRTYMRYL